MPLASTVLLRHRSRENTHLDWMLDLPGHRGDGLGGSGPGGALTTFRCHAPWTQWARLGRVALTELAPHRRVWLTRQGPVSGNRGQAVRLARGQVLARGGHVHGWHLRLSWPAGPELGAGEVTGRIVRLHQERWEFVVEAAGPAGQVPGAQAPGLRVSGFRTPTPPAAFGPRMPVAAGLCG